MKLVAVGDTFLPYCYSDFPPLGNVTDIIRDSDIGICNLEGPISQRGMPLEKCCLSMPPEAAKYFVTSGFNLFNLANNHIFDYGIQAFEETCILLSKLGGCWFGAGRNLQDAIRPAVKEINGVRIGFLGYGWDFIGCIYADQSRFGVSPLNRQLVIECVRGILEQVDVVVVSLHWGYERERYPLPHHRQLAHDIIDAGASVVLGHHPHVLQGIEEYHRGIIAYSLGNFIFPNYSYKKYHLIQREENRTSVILKCTFFTKNMWEWDIIPVYQKDDFVPVVLTGAEGHRVISEVRQLSNPFSLGIKDYRRFWSKHRIRKDLPEVRGTNLCDRLRLRSYRILHGFSGG